MDEYPESSSKRTRTSNGYSESPNGYRSQSPNAAHAESTPFQLAERPASAVRREQEYDAYRDDTPDELTQTFYTPLGHGSESSERKASISRSPLLRAIKPTTLHYKPRMVLHGHKKGVSMVKFSPNGRFIASASADGTVRIWNAQTGKHEQTLEGHLAGVSTISWSPDSKLIASGSDDKSIRLWDIATGKQHPKPLHGHHNSIYSLAFSPTGSTLVSGSFDEAVFLWDVRTPRLMRSLPAHSDPVSGVDFSLDGTLIASCAGDGLIRIWDTPTGQCLKTLVHEDMAPVTGVRFSPNGRFVAAWTLDACVRLWRYAEGRCVKTYQGHRNEQFALGGCFGVYGSVGWEEVEEEDEVEVEVEVEGEGGQRVQEEQRRQVERREARVSGTAAASSAAAGTAAGAVGMEELVLELQQGGSGGREKERYAFITSGSEDGAILFWDVQTKEILQRIDAAHSGAVLGVDAHPTLPLIASGGLDRTVRVWGMVEDPLHPPDGTHVGAGSRDADGVVDLNRSPGNFGNDVISGRPNDSIAEGDDRFGSNEGEVNLGGDYGEGATGDLNNHY